jgi:hypothetical protein
MSLEDSNDIFSQCSFRTVDGRKTQATSSDKVECCLNMCLNTVKRCNEYCKRTNDNDECYINCEKHRKFCIDYCEPYSNKNYKLYTDCAGENNCLVNDVIDKQCVIDNKNELIRCCRNNCLSVNNVDCDKFCLFSHDIAISGKDDEKVHTPHAVEKEITIHDLFVYILIAGIVLCIFFYMINKKYNIQ